MPVFLLSLRAGGTGLTLTRADHVIHVDRWWNPAVEDQATDRAYRIGQTRPVQVHRLVTRGTIEERIAELLARKRALADSVLAADGDLTALTELSDGELRDLVTLRPTRRRRETTGPSREPDPPAPAGPAGCGPGDHLVGQGVGAGGRGVVVRRGRPARRPRARALRPARRRSRSTAGASAARSSARTACRPSPAPSSCSTSAAAERSWSWSPPSRGGSPTCWPATCRIGLVEHAEEAGVELLPFAGEFSWTCTCDAWLDPCRHALAVGYQLAWLVDADPFVLLGLRGLPRDDLLARLHARGSAGPAAGPTTSRSPTTPPCAPPARCTCLAAGEPIDHLL